ncbi:PH domain-containing protein [Sphingobacterium paludis]|uniref:Putative oligomerization/nucleic acid binding protein n=1 Tax=Sphingobacterium paludis TaxID=1476465 RepID=A0A4R7DAR8_9SPHI|nr:PH domain-containing protein [Sphingobacterium paludis]TDS16176.1 putative oligomerization/nucleic acid binding protein [Sphingobacterium paludis]
MAIEKFLQDGQDPKVVEKIHDKIIDMLTAGEYIQYISVQKKPAVTLLPDSITVSNKRIFLCEFTKLGLATNFEIFSWNDIKDIAFKEEIFGAKVTVIPPAGENLTIDYIPKVQARKLYQLIKEALENRNATPASKPAAPAAPTPAKEPVDKEERPSMNAASDVPTEAPAAAAIIRPDAEPTKETPSPLPGNNISPAADEKSIVTNEDELTLKLKKLKTLYDRQLITQAEYENKKSELLSQL